MRIIAVILLIDDVCLCTRSSTRRGKILPGQRGRGLPLGRKATSKLLLYCALLSTTRRKRDGCGLVVVDVSAQCTLNATAVAVMFTAAPENVTRLS